MSDQARRLPADRGLTGLGLVMQVAGGAFGAITVFFGVTLLIEAGRLTSDPSNQLLWLLIATVSSAVRSVYHRKAGADLLYNSEQPFAGMRRYFYASIVNTIVWIYFFHSTLGAPDQVVVPFALALVGWPIAMVIVPTLPGYRDLAGGVPTGEDKGFEGAALLMLVFGLLGLLFMSLALYGLWAGSPGAAHTQGAFVMLVLAMIALIIRSALQVSAAITGLRVTRMDQVITAVNRYCDFGVLSSFLAGGVLLLGMMMLSPDARRLDPSAAAMIACLVWGLLGWPMVLRRFFSERQFADLLANADGPSTHHRAPDLGLTSLGWLLLGLGLFTLSASLPLALLSHGGRGFGHGGAGPFDVLLYALSSSAGQTPWWGVGMGALTLWAAIELIRMGELHRIAASAFGAIAAAVTLYQDWPLVSSILHHRVGVIDSIVGFGLILIQLVIPLVTLFAANRRTVPAATARYAA